jgi:L-amino acid N-acyltransferase YncA
VSIIVPPSDVLIRAAGHDDMAEIAAVFAYYVTDTIVTFEEVPPTTADWRRRLVEITGRGLPFLVAESGGKVVGFAFAGPWRTKPAYRHSVEDSVYLAPGWTGKGVGRALLARLLTECRTAGARQVIAVIVDGGEDASVALHRAFGFTQAGRLRGVGHKHGRRLDTILMQCELSAGGLPADPRDDRQVFDRVDLNVPGKGLSECGREPSAMYGFRRSAWAPCRCRCVVTCPTLSSRSGRSTPRSTRASR